MEIARSNLHRHHAANRIIHPNQINDMIFVEEIDFVFDTLLVERLQNHVAGAVGGVAGPHDRFARIFIGMAAKTALGDFAIGEAVKRQPHMFQFNNSRDGFFTQHIDGILIGQVIRAFNGVIGVPFPTVFFHICQGCANAALCRARM